MTEGKSLGPHCLGWELPNRPNLALLVPSVRKQQSQATGGGEHSVKATKTSLSGANLTGHEPFDAKEVKREACDKVYLL